MHEVQHTLPPSFEDRVAAAVLKCAPRLGFSPTADRAPPATPSLARQHAGWVQHLTEGKQRLPHRFTPPDTPEAFIHRHPYEGHPSKLTVGEFAVGSGCFMATALAVGFFGEWMAEHDADTLDVAIRNCPRSQLDVSLHFYNRSYRPTVGSCAPGRGVLPTVQSYWQATRMAGRSSLHHVAHAPQHGGDATVGARQRKCRSAAQHPQRQCVGTHHGGASHPRIHSTASTGLPVPMIGGRA